MNRILIIFALAAAVAGCSGNGNSTGSDSRSPLATEPERIITPPPASDEKSHTPLVTLQVTPDSSDKTAARVLIIIQDSTAEATEAARARYINNVSALTNTNIADAERTLDAGITYTLDDGTALRDWVAALPVLDKLTETDGADIAVAADKNTDYKVMNLLFETLRNAGLNKFTIITNLKTQ